MFKSLYLLLLIMSYVFSVDAAESQAQKSPPILVTADSIFLEKTDILATPFYLNTPKITDGKMLIVDGVLPQDIVLPEEALRDDSSITHSIMYKHVDLVDIPTNSEHPYYDKLTHQISELILDYKEPIATGSGLNALGMPYGLRQRVELSHDYGSEWRKKDGDLTQRECRDIREQALKNFNSWIDIDSKALLQLRGEVKAQFKNLSASQQKNLLKVKAIEKNIIFYGVDESVREKYLSKVLARMAAKTPFGKGSATSLFYRKKPYCFFKNYRESKGYVAGSKSLSKLIESPMLKSMGYDLSLMTVGAYDDAFKTNKVLSLVFNEDFKITKGSAELPEEIHISLDALYNEGGQHFIKKYVLVFNPKNTYYPFHVLNESAAVSLKDLKPVVKADIARTVFVWEDLKHNIKRVYPMGVGGIDFGAIKEGVVSSLTSQFNNGGLSKTLAHSSTIKERWDPYYFKGRPFIRISGSAIGFHYQVDTGNFKRGFRSHGCIRLRDQNLFELYALITNNAYDLTTPTTLKYEDAAIASQDHPLLWHNKIQVVQAYQHKNLKICVRPGRGGTPLIYTQEEDIPKAFAFKNVYQKLSRSEQKKCWRIRHSEHSKLKDEATGESQLLVDLAAQQLLKSMVADGVTKECADYQKNCPEKYIGLTGRSAWIGYTYNYKW